VQKRVMWRIVIASPLCVVGVVLLALLYPLPAQATNHAIVPTCTNNGDGTSYGCAASSGGAGAYKAIPTGTSLICGDIYYLTDYASYPEYTFSKSGCTGSTPVTFRKAQAWDYGGLSGFNVATMGSAQAVFPWTGGVIFEIKDGYLTMDGNSNEAAGTIGCGGVSGTTASNQTAPPPNPLQCGIKIDNSTCTTGATDGCAGGLGFIDGGGSYVVWKSVEWEGSDINPNEPYGWRENVSGSTNNQVTHSYLHALGTTCWTVTGAWNSGSFDHNYIWGTNDSSVNHGECLQGTGSDTGMNIFDNVFRDTITNGDLVFVDPVAGTHSDYNIYNNVVWCSSSSGCRHNDGFVACINSSQTCTNFFIYNNTIINCSTACGLNSTNAGSYTWENNIYYNSSVSWTTHGSSFTEDYNSFLNSGNPGSGAHDVHNTTSPVPFGNWNAGSGTLTGPATLPSDNANWNNRLSLGAPFDTDAAGNAFTDDRGAYQSAGATAGPGTPANLTATPH
jgi:hypothetical protein